MAGIKRPARFPRNRLATLLVVSGLAPAAAADAGQHFPRIGQCHTTRIAEVTYRLESMSTNPPKPMTDSGTSLKFTNGRWMVSYDTVPHVARWQRGEPVSLCVVHLPQHCPAGDYRGITYRATNLRRHDHWIADDNEHGCGGA